MKGLIYEIRWPYSLSWPALTGGKCICDSGTGIPSIKVLIKAQLFAISLHPRPQPKTVVPLEDKPEIIIMSPDKFLNVNHPNDAAGGDNDADEGNKR